MLIKEMIRRINDCKTAELTLSLIGLESEEVVDLTASINGLPYIKRLDLSFNLLDSKAIVALLQLEHVNQLDLSHNNFTDVDALIESEKFSIINLCGNNIPCETISRLMATTKTILQLDGNPGWASHLERSLGDQASWHPISTI